MNVTPEQVVAGQAAYTRNGLAVYDFMVHGVSSRFFWNCPTRRLEALYDQHLSANHLDVGVGTGYFLDRCRFPTPAPRIALMDLNQETLAFTARRIARYRPESYRRNVLEPIAIDAGNFDSVGLTYLLHCLPGNSETKAVVFEHLKALMNPGAVIFGATLLQGGVPRSWLATRLMEVYNRKGIFSNRDDTLAGLEQGLKRHFREVNIEVVGCSALFSGRV